jgi:ATP-dependent DNA ligase
MNSSLGGPTNSASRTSEPHDMTSFERIRYRRYACKMGLEGIVSKRLGSRYRSGRTTDWLKFKNPEAPAVKREAEEDWGN